MSVSVRVAKESDIDCLKKWLEEPGILKYFPMNDSREVEDSAKLWLTYAAKQAAFTAVKDGKVVGMAVLYIQPFEKLKHQCLFAIVVDPEERGQGIGTTLLKEIEKIGKKKHGLEILHLEVYEKNPAFELYKRLGFKEYGRQKHFLKEDDGTYRTKVCMQKGL